MIATLLNRSSRWPAGWEIPSEDEIRRVLKDVTLLIRTLNDDGRRLFVIDQSKLDIYQTDVTNLADTSWGPEEIKGLKVRYAYPGCVPIGRHWAGDLHVTVEDIVANLNVEDLTPGTLVEVSRRYVKIDYDEKLGGIWQVIFLSYERER